MASSTVLPFVRGVDFSGIDLKVNDLLALAIFIILIFSSRLI